MSIYSGAVVQRFLHNTEAHIGNGNWHQRNAWSRNSRIMQSSKSKWMEPFLRICRNYSEIKLHSNQSSPIPSKSMTVVDILSFDADIWDHAVMTS